ncbi:MAG: lysine-2,3-aminomutase-like protein [Hyphomicrobium sp.]
MTRDAPTLRTADDLVTHGLIPADAHDAIARVGAKYAIAITPEMRALIDTSATNDPIARQFVPDIRELDVHAAELSDPIGDHAMSPTPGLVHRYRDRVLLKIASVCPVYCRFCFRREMVGPDLGEALSADDLAAALAYIGAHREIWEVILTGGDPLVLSPRRIAETTRALSAIDHVKILRWHTRVPVVDPARITAQVIESLTATDRAVFVGVHVNHARELTADARGALAKLSDAGIALVSQSVLLKGVNDSVDALEDLMRALVAARVKPYYLHHGDLAPGTAHLRTTLACGIDLMAALRRRLSGLAMPTYVLDIPGALGKVPIEANVTVLTHGRYRVRDRDGVDHDYTDCCTDGATGKEPISCA